MNAASLPEDSDENPRRARSLVDNFLQRVINSGFRSIDAVFSFPEKQNEEFFRIQLSGIDHPRHDVGKRSIDSSDAANEPVGSRFCRRLNNGSFRHDRGHRTQP